MAKVWNLRLISVIYTGRVEYRFILKIFFELLFF